MAVGTLEQQTATIEIERSMRFKLECTQSKMFLYLLLTITDASRIELGMIHIPKHRLPNGNRSTVGTLKHPLAIGCKNLNLQQILLVDGNRVSTHIDTYIFDILLGHIQQIDVTIEATIKTEI